MQNVPVGQRAAGPTGWSMLTFSTDPTVPSMHLCPMCNSAFDGFMAYKP